MDFTKLVLDELTPIYMQIIRFVKVGIITGKAKSGDELISRRMLSSLLSINPNTVQKAFKTLEEEGLILSSAGTTSIITFDEETRQKVKQELLNSEISHFIENIKEMDMDLDTTLSIIQDKWR